MPAADFQDLQHALAAHLRDPEHAPPPPGVDDRRLQVYRELLYDNVEGFIATAFPVLRRISPDAVWHARVRDFYARHDCRALQFFRIAEEFLRFLENERGEHPDDPPFLRELCDYEWIELDLAVNEDELSDDLADANGDLLAGRPLVSPLAATLSYQYPVHRIAPDYMPDEPGEEMTYLIVNRDRHDAVRFLDINAITARLMDLLESDSYSSGRELLTRIAVEISHPRPRQLLDAGAIILNDLRARDVILGTRR
jgi:hypothetical protein